MYQPCSAKPPETQHENTLETLRYVVFVKLIQFLRLNNNESSKFISEDFTNSAENVIKNHLNLNNNKLINEIENFFYVIKKFSIVRLAVMSGYYYF